MANDGLAVDPGLARVIRSATALAAKLGFASAEELVRYLPRRHDDRRQGWHPSMGLPEGPVNFQGVVVRSKLNRWRGRRCSVEIDLNVLSQGLETGDRVRTVYFHLPFLARAFPEGKRVAVYGRLEEKSGVLRVIHPETETIEEGKEEGIHLDRVVPIYPLTAGLNQRRVRATIYHYLRACWPKVEEEFPPCEGMPNREEAWRTFHFPESLREVEIARRRLAWEELVSSQFGVRVRRAAREAICVARPKKLRVLVAPWMAHLPWKMTHGQTEVCKRIDDDLAMGRPMHRLLQGDVGSGKTLVAAHALLRALEHGSHVAFMAPTTLLVEQHATALRKLMPPRLVEIVTWTSASKPGPVGAFPRITVGTHALFAAKTKLSRLSLCVIDEQQRFGVKQRAAFLATVERPDLLVLTATPIPRTYDLLIHGDLDVSYLTEMPPGRGEVKTYVREGSAEEKIWVHLQDRVKAGDRAYVVVPRLGDEVEDPSEEASVRRTYELLTLKFGSKKVALLHGKMKEAEKVRILDQFRSGEISVLAATTVVEVGVDVPEANWMVIDHADRLGLSQLHQLRGRIGRGGKNGTCILIQRGGGPEAKERLDFLAENRDGFRIAERDFQIRGPGDTLGDLQSGGPGYRHVRFPSDMPLMESAAFEAQGLWVGGWERWVGLVEAGKKARADFAAN